MSFFRRAGAEILRVIERTLDPAAEPDRVLVYSKDVAGVSHLFARDSNGAIFPLTPQMATGGARQLVDVTTAAVPPAYAVFPLSVALTTTLGTFLDVRFSAAVLHGPNAGMAAINFRFRLNGILIAPGGGTTLNSAANQIQNLIYTLRVPVVAGLQTITVEWATFALPAGNTAQCLPLTAPDLFHAQLVCREIFP